MTDFTKASLGFPARETVASTGWLGAVGEPVILGDPKILPADDRFFAMPNQSGVNAPMPGAVYGSADFHGERSLNADEIFGLPPMTVEVTQVGRPPLVPIAVKVLQDLIAILEERGASYADFSDNSAVYQTITAQLGITSDLTPTARYGMSMIATKLARFATGAKDHEDTFLDIANYAVLMVAVMRREKGETS